MIHRKLLVQCDSEGFVHNCLVPLRHCLPSPGGPLKYSLEGHRFAIFSCCVSTDKRYVVSVSNKYAHLPIDLMNSKYHCGFMSNGNI